MGKLMLSLLLSLALSGPAGASAPLLVCGMDDTENEFIAVDVMPEMIYQASPEYPAEAKANGIEGKVTLGLRVEIDGTVSGPKVKTSSGSSLLDQAALTAAGKYRFKPALQDGKPVAVWVSFTVTFVLDSQKENIPPADTFIPVESVPEIVKEVQPTYPPEALAGKMQGKVFVRMFVDSSGKVKKAEIAQSSGKKVLDDAALEAGRQFEFKPAQQNGRPVGVWISFPIVFALE